MGKFFAILKFCYYFNLTKPLGLLLLEEYKVDFQILLLRHVDEIKCGIKHRVEKVRETQAEDKEVGHMSHLVIF